MATYTAWQKAQRLESHKQESHKWWVLHHAPSYRKEDKKRSEISSRLLRVGGAGPQVQGQLLTLPVPTEMKRPSCTRQQQREHGYTWPQQRRATPSLLWGELCTWESFTCHRVTPGCSQRVWGALPITDTAPARAEQLRAPEWRHTTERWENPREMSQLARHRTHISLHIRLLLSTCLLHLPLAPKRKREANAHLITFFRKSGDQW